MNHTEPETPWTRYLRLMGERPEAFTASSILPIETDPQEIAQFTARTGRTIGVVYESPYHLMVVDLVRGPEGLFAYERVLPAVHEAAVVAVPVWEGKFVLLKQFRHALRGVQTAFPRGFGEKGLSAEENTRKEVWEELRARVLEQRTLGKIAADSGLTGGEAHVSLCQITRPEPPLHYEAIQCMICLSQEELEWEIARGHINDGFTLSAYALYQARGIPDQCRSQEDIEGQTLSEH